MAIVFGLDTAAVRAESQRVVTSLGGPTCDWLPWLDRSEPRNAASVIGRTLVMNAMLQIHFGAPVERIRAWISEHALNEHLSRREREILRKSDDEITDQEDADLSWSIEGLWTLVWAGSLIPDLPIDELVGDELAGLLPDLQRNESPERFVQSFKLRSPDQIYQMLDLYYLAHWYAREGQLRRFETGPFSMDVIMERRKALEWLMDSQLTDWDEAPDHT